jgi:hypothetical protein|eukprot:COSAG02_NODE_13081_length_1448_cov_1.850259_2_plen_53_part_00
MAALRRQTAAELIAEARSELNAKGGRFGGLRTLHATMIADVSDGRYVAVNCM